MPTFDLRDFERAADAMKAARDQLPFAISLALNKAAAATESRLATETWAAHTANRNKGFFKAAMAIDIATKGRLQVSLYDSLGRAKIALHAHGGIAQAKGRFAVPTSAVRKTSRGVAANMRPSAIDPKRKVVKDGLIFRASGKGEHRKLTLLYKLTPTVRIKPDVPLEQDFDRFFREEMRREFPVAVRRAMRTRR
ncbi:hypothetical protein [Methylobacterium nigriterrae]|uniref:hypothetical protein n=1 Tax=Methylobacterium nigriterrae TaxID=3127512 RepID=UPI003013E877